MSAVAVAEAQPLAAVPETPAGEAGALISMIDRAARDPSVDVDKMVRLFDLHERAVDRASVVAFNRALADMQPQLPVITERGKIVVPGRDNKPGHETPYARWEDINEAILPILHEHGFALSFRPGTAADGKVTVTGVLRHRDGHQDEATVTLMHDSSGSKNAVQAVGSSLSYGKRYAAINLLNITSRGEDDDGKAAGASQADALADAAEAAIKACRDMPALKAWRQANEPHFDSFGAAGRKRVISIYNEQRAALAGGAA